MKGFRSTSRVWVSAPFLSLFAAAAHATPLNSTGPSLDPVAKAAGAEIRLSPSPFASGSPRSGPEAAEAFPRPAALDPQIAFWTKIYSVYPTSQALIHDSERLDVVYSVVDLPEEPRVRSRILKWAQERHIEALRDLAGCPDEGDLSDLERKVKAAWGEGTDPEVFEAAAERVRAQIGQADRFRLGVQRAGAYLPKMQEIMAELGLPEELLALPHVESSFNPHALSHRGASGIWQWTRSTGRHYLRIDRAVDERRDPLLATRAAGLCLRQYHEELGSWPLAITAYNHGLQGMRRARAEHGSDIVDILRDYDGRAFKFASRNFYTEFLAALDVFRNYEVHFGEITPDQGNEFDAVRLPQPLGIHRAAKLAGASVADMQKLNPALLKPVLHARRPIPAGYELRVPAGRGARVAARVGAGNGQSSKALLVSTAASAAGASEATYRVERGDTLSQIAARYGTTVNALYELNRLDSHRIVAGQELIVPAAH